MSVTEPIYIAAANEASIRAAAAAATAHGGGIVKIPAGTITLTQPLPAYAGVVYQGTAYQAYLTSGQTAGVGGTILQGDGTFNGYQYNQTDGGVAPTDYNTFLAGMIDGVGLLDLTLVNFLYGVKIGALYQPGCQYSRFARLNIINCQQWGFWLENYGPSRVDDLNIINCQVGGLARVGSGATAFNDGNTRWIGNFVQTASSLYARGIVAWARSASSLNSNTSIGEQCNRVGSVTPLSQAATMTNASANIGVTDSTKFPVGLPVTFNITANGFVASEIYFVLTSAANVITVGRTTYGTAVSATGNTAINCLSKGYACLEVAGLDATSTVTAETMLGVDLESIATMMVFAQNARYCEISGGYIDPSNGGNHYRTFVARNSINNTFRSQRNSTLDFDNASTQNYFFGMRAEYQAIDFTNDKQVGIGVSVQNQSGQRVATSRGILHLNGFNYPDIGCNADTNAMEFKKGISIEPIQITNGATIALTNGSNYTWTYTSAGGSATLPAISTNMPGAVVFISNPQSNSFTLNSAGETFNGVAGTSITVAANSTIMLVAADAGGTIGKYWAQK